MKGSQTHHPQYSRILIHHNLDQSSTGIKSTARAYKCDLNLFPSGLINLDNLVSPLRKARARNLCIFWRQIVPLDGRSASPHQCGVGKTPGERGERVDGSTCLHQTVPQVRVLIERERARAKVCRRWGWGCGTVRSAVAQPSAYTLPSFHVPLSSYTCSPGCIAASFWPFLMMGSNTICVDPPPRSMTAAVCCWLGSSLAATVSLLPMRFSR